MIHKTRPPPIPPDGRASWLPPLSSSSSLPPQDPQLPPEAWCPKDSPLVDSRPGAAERSPKLGHSAPSHVNGRPLSCPLAESGSGRAQHSRLDGQADGPKVRPAEQQARGT